MNPLAPGYQQNGLLRVHVVPEAAQAGDNQHFLLTQPSLASTEPLKRLAALATSFLGWQLSMALYGYLQHITFAGQPAVENYKARARALRTQSDPLQVASHWQPALQDGILTLLVPHTTDRQNTRQSDPQQRDTEIAKQRLALSPIATAFASAMQEAIAPTVIHPHPQGIAPEYLDLTVNGEAQAHLLSMLNEHVHTIGNKLVGIPVKLRQAPAAYHSTEQSEMDGPPSLISLRLVARNAEASFLGSYTNTFLHAQAVSTWQAMMEAGRTCFLLVIDGSLDDAMEPLSTFFSHVERYLHHTLSNAAVDLI